MFFFTISVNNKENYEACEDFLILGALDKGDTDHEIYYLVIFILIIEMAIVL